jgi:enamine deaminase RidA (YjgF/YER057c/UK114 family)
LENSSFVIARQEPHDSGAPSREERDVVAALPVVGRADAIGRRWPEAPHRKKQAKRAEAAFSWIFRPGRTAPGGSGHAPKLGIGGQDGLYLGLRTQEGAAMTVKLSNPPTLPTRGGYSQVCEVTSGKLILVAGQVPHDVNDKMVGEGSFETQVEQVFRNLDAALKAAGGNLKNLVKIVNYCVASVSYEERMVYRTVRDRWVNTANPPVSTFIYVVKLAQPNWLFEMDAMAVIDG